MNKIINMPTKRKGLNLYQHTIKNEIHCNGIGLHSGKEVKLRLLPAKENQGITFIRTDLESGKNVIKATYNNVIDTRMCTVIGNEFGANVGTVEHIVSAVRGCNIDNITIEIDGPEVPIMDGSSDAFVFLFDQSGIKQQKAKRKAIRMLKKVELMEQDKYVSMEPADKTSFDFEIEFNSKAIGRQTKTLRFEGASFREEISKARTFGFLKDVEMLKSMGLALGGSLDNAIVVDGDKILNEEELRYNDEFVSHKILDSIGDLFLAGAPIIGAFKGIKSGHDLNNKLLRAIFADASSYEIVDMLDCDEFNEINAPLNMQIAM